MPKIDLADKKILVVDDFKSMRTVLKSMLQKVGASNIDQAVDGYEAIAQAKVTQYDIILCDYNMGDGPNGMDVLGELRDGGDLKHSAVFMMVTAVANPGMVMGALEHLPDAYMIKPFNVAEFIDRLTVILERREIMSAINDALDAADHDQVLRLCQIRIAQADSRDIVHECERIQADTLFRLNKFPEASEAFMAILEKREALWARVGLGKIYYLSEKYEESTTQFKYILAEHKEHLVARDWLAKALIKQGEMKRAQSVLEKAVAISPNSLARQRKLADIAEQNEDVEVAEAARRNVLRLSKFSPQKDPDDILRLANQLQKQNQKTADGLDDMRPCKEALHLLEGMEETYSEREDLMIRLHLLKGAIFNHLKEKGKAQDHLRKAVDLYDKNHPSMKPMDQVSVARDFFYSELGHKGELMIRILLCRHRDEADVTDKIREFYYGPKITPDEANHLAVEMFRSQQYAEAVELFELAATELPDNVAISLNAAQALITFMSQGGKRTKILFQRCGRYLDQAKDIKATDAKRLARYKELLKLYSDLLRAGVN
ncbi:response regulator [Piscirickettsia salmonis]|uniref:response regulator n=1 Tax=Piscirickettsia salmonis TaxID=1238 RepID=UPI0007C905F9|nr:Chemotaxis protein CheY [Piscirickettsiaceae bacterium NZ-RLO1]